MDNKHSILILTVAPISFEKPLLSHSGLPSLILGRAQSPIKASETGDASWGFVNTDSSLLPLPGQPLQENDRDGIMAAFYSYTKGRATL